MCGGWRVSARPCEPPHPPVSFSQDEEDDGDYVEEEEDEEEEEEDGGLSSLGFNHSDETETGNGCCPGVLF